VQTEATSGADICYDGRLLSGRRPQLIIIAVATGLIMAIALDSWITVVALAEVSFALIAMRLLWPDSPLLYPTVSFEVDEGEITIVRPSGRRHVAPWSTFDEARVRPMGGVDTSPEHTRKWKLTLMNARKASISSFINADARMVMFMLPVELSFEATAEEARDLFSAINGMIELEQTFAQAPGGRR